MIDPEEKDMQLFSWTALFAVTAFSCFLFSAMLSLIEGESVPLFLYIGFASLGLTGVFALDRYLKARSSKKKNRQDRFNEPSF